MRLAPHRSASQIALLLVAAAGCTSRTLPLPPPTIEEVSAPDAQGMVVVRGLAQENASVGVLNEQDRVGVIVSSPEVGCARSCAWEARLEAVPGDAIRAWQFFETEGNAMEDVPAP